MADQQAMMAELETMQMRDSLRTFNGLVERCFSDCVTGFRSKSLTEHEDKCVNACAEKFFNHARRVGQRFGELSQKQQEEMMKTMQNK
ncbi:Tim10/DDP family zinc finger protein [Pavlovales sp. CCMP2436]|nr:Tim10/DDP family zinc finger protein [Pavlovales sp. CCMP2436]|mmetsp:Transcript_14804/g.37393  ORF Transcript_14804/g.37393 Transcript_14804/m.37393 type:complete len:88 (-) Transcript_14804:433-696(-)